MAVLQAMVRVYVSLYKNGRRTMEQIPEEYREAVAAELAAEEKSPG